MNFCPDPDPEAPITALRKEAARLGFDVTPTARVVPGLVLSGLTLTAIQSEATRAHLLHGRNSMLGPNQTDERRLAILTEEVGEVAKELNEASIRLSQNEAGSHDWPPELILDRDALVKELIQVSAMAASWVEALEGAPARMPAVRGGLHHTGTGDIT